MRVSKQFKADFDLVARHFNLAELGELEDAKDAVRRDPEGAMACFAAMGADLRVAPRTAATGLPTITREEIDAEIRKAHAASKRGIVRDVRSGGRNNRMGALESGGARKGKVTESA